jgi:hypothetical protein
MRNRSIISLLVSAFVGWTIGSGLLFSVNASNGQSIDPQQSASTSLTCPKCKGTMESGLIRDYFSLNSVDCYPSKWSTGLPKVFGHSHMAEIKIEAHRCIQCGYLESYAK